MTTTTAGSMPATLQAMVSRHCAAAKRAYTLRDNAAPKHAAEFQAMGDRYLQRALALTQEWSA